MFLAISVALYWDVLQSFFLSKNSVLTKFYTIHKSEESLLFSVTRKNLLKAFWEYERDMKKESNHVSIHFNWLWEVTTVPKVRDIFDISYLKAITER